MSLHNCDHVAACTSSIIGVHNQAAIQKQKHHDSRTRTINITTRKKLYILLSTVLRNKKVHQLTRANQKNISTIFKIYQQLLSPGTMTLKKKGQKNNRLTKLKSPSVLGRSSSSHNQCIVISSNYDGYSFYPLM